MIDLSPSRLEMASIASPTTFRNFHNKLAISNHSRFRLPVPSIVLCRSHIPQDNPTKLVSRREIILRSSEFAMIGAILQLSGKRPDYLGVQKNSKSLSLCPATNNCISTSENASDLVHYAPPWNYNGKRKKPVNRGVAMEELLQVINSTTPNKFAPRVVEKKDDYVHVEYESPVLGFVDDVEFWFPPDKNSTVEYRSASRRGNFDFDVNRKRIKVLRQELEKKGWASQEGF